MLIIVMSVFIIIWRGNGMALFTTKPFPKPMVIYDELILEENTSLKF